MQTKDVIVRLRTERGMTQDELAQRVFVTRQAVSRWELGETVPNVETLKLLSVLFNVSINTLLGSPKRLVCQCCGMPLDELSFSRDKEGIVDENYCKWCYKDGEYIYTNLTELIDFLVEHRTNTGVSPEEDRVFLESQLPKLNYGKNKRKLTSTNVEN